MAQQTETKKTDLKTVVNQKNPIAGNIESFIKWQFTEEKKVHSKDREMLIIIIGIGAVALAIIVGNYIFSILLIFATATLINTTRRKPRKLLFNITPIGIFMDDDFVETEYIKGFNIIDDPGENARLIVKIEKIININEIIPIYDSNIQDIEQAFTQLEIPKEEALEPTPLDRLTAMVI